MQLIKTDKVPLMLRLIRIFEQLLFIVPVIILIYKGKGLTEGDFFLVQGIHAFSIFLLEIPTGYIADIFSRRVVIILSTFAWFVGNFVLWYATNFWEVLSSELIFAISVSLYSGTAEAYLYDSLKKDGKEKDIVKQQSGIDSLAIWATAFATVTGGIAYNRYGADFTLSLCVIASFTAFILSMLLPEIGEEKRKVEKGQSKFKDMMNIAAYATKHPEIKWLMLYPAIFGSGTLALVWGQQPLMERSAIPTFLFGFFMGAGQFFRGCFAHFSSHLLKSLGFKKYTLTFFCILVIGFICAATVNSTHYKLITYPVMFLVGFASASQVSLRLVMSSLINHRIKSDERATILSVNSMFSKLFSAMVMISLKFLIDGWGLKETFMLIGSIVIITSGYALYRLIKLEI